MSEVEFHFALEGISGKGKNFLLDCLSEVKAFLNAEKLDSSKTDWIELYNLFKSKNL